MSSRRSRRCKSDRKVGLEDDKCAARVCWGGSGEVNSSSGSSSKW